MPILNMTSNTIDIQKNPSSIEPGSRRKRGAQPGNHNAVKHGFYSAVFKQIESELLASQNGAKFEGEIDLLRVIVKRTMDKANEQTDLSLEESFSLLRNVSFALATMQRFARLENLPVMPVMDIRQGQEIEDGEG